MDENESKADDDDYLALFVEQELGLFQLFLPYLILIIFVVAGYENAYRHGKEYTD